MKELRVGWFCLAGCVRVVDRRLPTPALGQTCTLRGQISRTVQLVFSFLFRWYISTICLKIILKLAVSNRFQKSIFSDIMNEFTFQSMIEKNLGPFYITHCVMTGSKLFQRHWCSNFFASSTKHHTSMLLLKELAAKHNVMFERLILNFNRNFLGRNFTERYELADICRFTAVHRCTHHHRWTTVNRKADHGRSTSARCIVPSWTSNISWTANHIFCQVRLGAIWRKLSAQISLGGSKCYFWKHLK